MTESERNGAPRGVTSWDDIKRAKGVPEDHQRPVGYPWLDVDRLAQAIASRYSLDLDEKDEWYTSPRLLAEGIAAEYARLSDIAATA